MRKSTLALRLGATASAMALLSGCGGGGGGSGSSGGGTPPVSTAPNITSSSTATVTENVTGTVYTATATDPQGDAITWDVFSGADAGLFTVTAGGALAFQDAPNYDLPNDANRDNVYEVTIRARAGGEQDTQALRVAVENDKEGIEIRRVLTGLVDPVSLSWTGDEEILLIAEQNGRVMTLNGADGTLSENTFVRDNRLPGEVLAATYTYPNPRSTTPSWNEAILLATYDPTEGLRFQTFDPIGRSFVSQLVGPAASEAPKTSISSFTITNEFMFITVGDPEGSLAQDAASPYGKLYEITPGDPYAGASLPAPEDKLFSINRIGDGVSSPGGLTTFRGMVVLGDQGAGTANGLTLFDRTWRPLDFGAPFYEGATAVRDNPPARVNGPTIAYNFGEGFGEGAGIVAGFEFATVNATGIADHYVFADKSGKIWSIPSAVMDDGFLHFGDELEDRSEDFAPDSGSIDSVVQLVLTENAFYILDADGDVFRLDRN